MTGPDKTQHGAQLLPNNGSADLLIEINIPVLTT
jgi:hypothetical protein